MFATRFWTLLLALAGGIGLAVILLAKDVVNRERVENASAILYKELSKTDVALKLYARQRLDVLLSVALDPEVRRTLAMSSVKSDKASTAREKLLTSLRNHNKGLGKYRGDMLIALNRTGEVVAQVGRNERRYGYKLVGFPVVDAALRGFIRDDVWRLDKDVFLVAARPVIEQGQYVGALLHGVKVTDKVASDLSPIMQLVFFAGDVAIAVGTPSAEGVVRAQGAYVAKPLDEVIRSEQFKKKGYSEIKSIDTNDGRFMAVYSSVRGEAAKRDVGYALVTAVPQLESAAEFYEKAGTQDIEALPKAWLIIAVLLVFGIGWGLTYLEGERPVSRLFGQVQALEKSDPKDQLNVYQFRRKIRKLAILINKVIDYKMRSLLDSDGASQKSIDSILGSGDSSRLSSARFKFAEPTPSEVPPAPPPTTSGGPPLSGPNPVIPDAPPATGSNRPPTPAAAFGGPAGGSGAPRPPAPPTGPPPPAVPTSQTEALSPQEEQAYFKKIYQDFVSLKKKLGESTEQLTYERFEGTLKRNRNSLIARYGCKRVLFQVYEKDGKTSLKATPVRT